MPATNRKSPLAIAYSGYLTETIEARLPEHFSISASSGTIATNWLDFRYSFGSTGNNLKLAYRLRQLRDHVPVDGLVKHSDAIAKIHKVLGYQLVVCGPGYSITPDATEHDSFMFDGRRISVVRLKCHRCARPKDVYFAVAGAKADR